MGSVRRLWSERVRGGTAGSGCLASEAAGRIAVKLATADPVPRPAVLIALIQRVERAHVDVEGETIGAIGPGLLALIAVQPTDDGQAPARMLERLLAYRVFGDDRGRMNRSLRDTGGGLLLVPQFTLAADTGKGLRPSFDGAAPPGLARERFEQLEALARADHSTVASGRFGAEMRVHLVNHGPVTFWLTI